MLVGIRISSLGRGWFKSLAHFSVRSFLLLGVLDSGHNPLLGKLHKPSPTLWLCLFALISPVLFNSTVIA